MVPTGLEAIRAAFRQGRVFEMFKLKPLTLASAVAACVILSACSGGSDDAVTAALMPSQFVGAADGEEVTCTKEQLEHNRQLVQTFFAPERTPLGSV